MTQQTVVTESSRARQHRLLSLHDVEERVCLKKTAIYEKIRDGAFPRPVKIGRWNRWLDHEIDRWIEQRIEERDAGVAQ